MSQEGSIIAYRIATLIQFYRITVERTIGVDALMSQVLVEQVVRPRRPSLYRRVHLFSDNRIREHAYEVFFETLKAQGRSLLRFIQVRLLLYPSTNDRAHIVSPIEKPPAATLSSPPVLREALSTLREIMLVYSSSLLEEDTSMSSLSRETEFDPVLDTILHPALEMCGRMGEMRSSEWDRSIFGINCWESCINALEGFEFTDRRRKALEEQEEVFVDLLIGQHVSFVLLIKVERIFQLTFDSQFAHLLAESGLEPILTALNTKDAEVRPSPSLASLLLLR